jgi:hypothetical protein
VPQVVSTLAPIKRKPGFKVCFFKWGNLHRYGEANTLIWKEETDFVRLAMRHGGGAVYTS